MNLYPASPALAAISACSASVSPASVNTNQSATLAFTVTNNDSTNSGVWVRITSPSEDFQINGGSSSGWSRTVETTQVTYTGGTLAGGANGTFNVTIQTGLSGSAAQTWTVAVSDDSGGSGATTCSGSTGVAIAGDTTAPTISNISATNVGTTSATITWTTNESATSVVRYGLTTSYGTTVTGASGVTSHSVSLSGLTANTTYHYRVESADGAGNLATSGDNVFTTSATSSSLAISGVSAGSITSSSATITWTTNIPASSQVNYGATTSYGSSESTSTQVVSHSLTLSGLSASSAYHYRVQSSDASTGHTVQSGDNTFTTAAASSGPSTGSGSATGGGGSGGGGGGGSSSTTSTTKTTSTGSSGSGSGGPSTGSTGSPQTGSGSPGDTTGPVVRLTTDFSRPYARPPRLTGTASDSSGVQRVWYSLDGGVNWLPVSIRAGASVAFSVTLSATLPDDNYAVRVRAQDGAGNFGYSPLQQLIIDQLPPLVGTSLYAVGAQILYANETLLSTVIAGLDQQITVSAIGGPTSVDIVARPREGSAGEEHVFSLVKNKDSGLWQGTLHLPDLGEYDLLARAEDGAANHTERHLRTVAAVQGSRVMAQEEAVAGARVEIRVYNPFRRLFEHWEAAPFNQQNPQTTNKRGEWQAFVPPGRYYVRVEADGWRRAQTPIFELEGSRPLQLVIPLSKAWCQWCHWWPKTVQLGVHEDVLTAQAAGQPPGLGEALPAVTVGGAAGEQPLNEVIKGPAVVTLITEWSPHTAEQMAHLEILAEQLPGKVWAVLEQSSWTAAQLWQARGHYTVPLLADSKGAVAAELKLDATPVSLLVAEDGVIADVRFAPRSHQELTGALQEVARLRAELKTTTP